MKRFFAIALFVVFTTGAFAADKIPSAVVLSFQTNFANATQVKYSEVSDMIRVDFFNGQEQQSAYYNSVGELIVLTHARTLEQLPARLQTDLQKRYSAYTVTAVHQFENAGGTEYFVFLEGGKKDLVLNANGERWKTFRVTGK